MKFQRPDPGNVRAHMFASLGLKVFPLVASTKRPAIREWPEKATSDLSVIETWWGERPELECGILTGPESGIWVLDLDQHPDKDGTIRTDGLRNARELFAKNGDDGDPDTFRVQSPHGEQWWFAYPPEGKVANFACSDTARPRVAPGVDVRGWHGQVVAPLGLGRPIIDGSWPPARAPEWLEKLVIVKPYADSVPTYVSSNGHAVAWAHRLALQLAGCPNGGRNAALNTTAFKLGLLGSRGLLDEATALELLRDACWHNGLIEEDGENGFRATFASGWSAGIREGVK